MSNKISWQPCDYWREETINGKTYRQHVKQQLVCQNPRVEKVWFTGSTGTQPGSPIITHLNVICKDGHREELKFDDTEFNESEALNKMEKILDGYFILKNI